jgi:magnesium-protoporphyrin O-methyltransferase
MLEPAPKPADHRECCPADPRIARTFDRRMRDAAARGALPEMVNVTRALVDLLDDVADQRPTLLELGCGSGALTVELLRRGATRADGVDLSAESLALAERRAREAGVEDRTTFVNGDASVVGLETHDWVVLDRVICCYRHLGQLLANAIPAAGRRFVFSVPADHGWRGLATRSVLVLERLISRLRGGPCPAFVHDIATIERRLAEAGFVRLRQRTVGLWYAAVFERPTTASATV